MLIFRLCILQNNSTLDVLNSNKLNASLLTSPAYSTNGISAVSSRATIASGGYYKVGKLCVFEAKLTINTSLAGTNYWSILQGLPYAKVVGLGAAIKEGTSGQCVAFINNSGVLYIYNDMTLASGNTLNVAVIYTTA